MPIPAGKYDVVLGLNILQLMENIDDAIGKCATMLKPGGYFISSSVCMTKPPGMWKYLLGVMQLLQLFPKVQGFTEAQLLQSHRAAGFEIVEQFNHENQPVVFLVAKKLST